MFVEYLRIIDKSGGDLGSQWQLTGQIAIIAAVCTLLMGKVRLFVPNILV
jgi:hypothetical protein